MRTSDRFNAFAKAMSFIQSETKLQLELTQLHAMMAVYKSGERGIAIGDLAKTTKVSSSAAGRTAATLSTYGHKDTKMKGWGLCEAFTDYERPAFKIIRNTVRGKEVMDKFIDLLEA